MSGMADNPGGPTQGSVIPQAPQVTDSHLESVAAGLHPSRSVPWSSRVTFEVIALAPLLLVAAIVYLLQFDSRQIGINVDDAQYISIARGLASGLGYAPAGLA